MPYTITFPGRTTDAGYSWPITLTAPEGWQPKGYHVTTCGARMTDRYSRCIDAPCCGCCD